MAVKRVCVCNYWLSAVLWYDMIYWILAAQGWFTTYIYNTHTHTRLTAPCPGLPGWAGTTKVKPVWILLKQEIMSGNGISWAICKSAHRSRQITMPTPHHSVFTGHMPFLPPNQQRQSTAGLYTTYIRTKINVSLQNMEIWVIFILAWVWLAAQARGFIITGFTNV